MRRRVSALGPMMMLVSACAGTGSPATTPVPPTVASTMVPPTTAGPPTTVPSTTTAPATVPTTTTTEVAPVSESWIVPGQAYYFPVQPPADASYGRDHHDYPATDIFAAVGTIVVSVTNGVIDEMSAADGWDPDVDDPSSRSGRYVTVIGDDGIRYHLSHFETVAPDLCAGCRVRAGQRIGTVGNSGNAAQTPSHTHFGISHPTFAGDWEVRRGEVWPWEYLDAWKLGVDLTPDLEG
jgi:murein DD-endopeptidase MepM/ murein hydrolase activator NlpD